MNRDEAIQLVSEALSRLENPQPNANGGEFQAGGAYWRLAKVLKCYLEPEVTRLEEDPEFIFNAHGKITR